MSKIKFSFVFTLYVFHAFNEESCHYPQLTGVSVTEERHLGRVRVINFLDIFFAGTDLVTIT
jgi:hypothetical protein